MKGEPILEPSYTVARFWRCALQLNPSGYQAKYRGAEHGLDEAGYSQQVLDQCLSSTLYGLQARGMQYGRGNADNALAYADNPFLVERSSDHDGFVLFLESEGSVNTTAAPDTEPLAIRFSQPMAAGGSISIRSRSGGPLESVEFYTLQGQLAWRAALSGQEATLQLPVFITGGQMYLMRVSSEQGVKVEKVIVK